MMLTLGFFVFMLQTLPYQSLNRTADYRWPSNAAWACARRRSF